MKLQIKRIVCTLMIVFALLSLSSCINSTDTSDDAKNTEIGESSRNSDLTEQADNSKEFLTPSDIAKRLLDSTVLINSSSGNISTSGTGFIVSTDGYIVTSYQTIEDFPIIQVSFNNEQALAAEVVGYSKRDNVAVLKVDSAECVAMIGNSDEVDIGVQIYSMEKFRFCQGVVSSIGNKVSYNLTSYVSELICFLSTEPHSGYSGVVCNQYGEIIGLSLFYDNETGFSKVLPINGVMKIANSIMSTGSSEDVSSGYSRVKPLLGIHGSAIKTGETFIVGSPATRDGYAVAVVSASGMANGVLEVGDIIFELAGCSITNEEQLNDALFTCGLSQNIQVKVDRHGSILNLELDYRELG